MSRPAVRANVVLPPARKALADLKSAGLEPDVDLDAGTVCLGGQIQSVEWLNAIGLSAASLAYHLRMFNTDEERWRIGLNEDGT